ncbi:MAG: DNA-3-methyladenine glycosylase I [Alphaproteobacteria bacterium]|nr:DNA-3-methyladenine glycosylase I [Alphaproteobacteria bacterium]
MSGYCDVSPGHEWHGPYHDNEYGFPVRDESKLFEHLILEINQAGLSWLTILKKREGFARAYDGFDVDIVADYGPKNRVRLLNDSRIIRNKLKVNAAISNATRIRHMRETHGGFANWLDAHHPLSKEDWVRLFKKTFWFSGGDITSSFLMGSGYLPGAHRESCPIFEKIRPHNPPWLAKA